MVTALDLITRDTDRAQCRATETEHRGRGPAVSCFCKSPCSSVSRHNGGSQCGESFLHSLVFSFVLIYYDEQNQNPQMDTDEDVQKGKLSLAKKDYATAVEHFSAAVERFVHHYGQLASECGEVYYYYGLALFREVEQQEENQDVFGSAVPREIPTGRSEDAGTEPSCAVPSSTGDSETLKDGDSSEVQAQQQETKDEDSKEEDGGNEEGDEDEDAPAPEEQGDSNVENVEDPLQLAWEVLDTARTIFEKDDDQNIRLADVLLLLGDVCLRNEMFDNAVQDYEKCLSIRTQILKPDDRLIMEVRSEPIFF